MSSPYLTVFIFLISLTSPSTNKPEPKDAIG
jgi:hypothetical protein